MRWEIAHEDWQLRILLHVTLEARTVSPVQSAISASSRRQWLEGAAESLCNNFARHFYTVMMDKFRPDPDNNPV